MSHLKPYLSNPLRVQSIQAYREKLSKAQSFRKRPTPARTPPASRDSLKLEEDSALRTKIKESTTFIEMNLPMLRNHGATTIPKFVELTIIDEPFLEHDIGIGDFPALVTFLAEDQTNNVCTLQVSGIPENEVYPVGTRIMSVDCALQSWIQADSKSNSVKPEKKKKIGTFEMKNFEIRPMGIIPVDRKVDMCRYCGEENAKQMCRICGVLYCSRECQVADWKVLKHKIVCKPRGTEAKVWNCIDPVPRFNWSIPNHTGIARIISFRQKYNVIFRLLRQGLFKKGLSSIDHPIIPELEDPLNPEPILLRNMKSSHLHHGSVIDLTIVDEPLLGYEAMHFLVKDKRMQITHLAVYGLSSPENEGTREMRLKLQVGTELSVVNPFYKLGAADGLPMIRVDNPKWIVGVVEKVNVCRYCGREGAERKCRWCDRLYCGRICLEQDLRILKHGLAQAWIGVQDWCESYEWK